MTIRKPIFWEKTVEWEFVRHYLPAAMASAPLDGDIEIGDAILSSAAQWLVIEFKGVKSDCKDESRKYPRLTQRRTRTLVRKHYRYHRLSFEAVLENNPAWWSDVISVEQHYLMFKWHGPFLQPGSSFPPGLFGMADVAHEHLLKTYRDVPWSAPDAKEPHFFVFADRSTFPKLLAWPYWSDCHARPGVSSRGEAPFDAATLWGLGVPFADFAGYVHTVATARGYDPNAIEDLGSTEDGISGSVVFGHVMATATTPAAMVVMPLRKLLAILPGLARQLQLDLTVPVPRKQNLKP